MVALQALQFDCKDCVQYQHVQFLCDLQTRAAQLADLVDPASVLEAFHFNFVMKPLVMSTLSTMR